MGHDILYSIISSLIGTVDHTVAIALIETEQEFLTQLGTAQENRSVTRAALQHLEYLNSYWMPESMWQSWSEWGRRKAAERIGIPVQSVIPTTNHLESFNCVIKRKYIRSWLRSGNRLRVDFLILVLITRILPDIFSRHRTRAAEKEWIAERFRQQSGGKDLLPSPKRTRVEEILKAAWWSIDETHQSAAIELASKGHLMSIGHPDADTYAAACASSTTADVLYSISLCRSGEGACTCPDFQKRGGACKHLRALRLVIDSLVLIGQERAFLFPANPLEAAQVERRSLASLASTSPLNSSTKLPPMVNFSAIQAFGDDNTVLGNDLDKGLLDEYSDDEPDEDRVGDESNLGTVSRSVFADFSVTYISILELYWV